MPADLGQGVLAVDKRTYGEQQHRSLRRGSLAGCSTESLTLFFPTKNFGTVCALPDLFGVRPDTSR